MPSPAAVEEHATKADLAEVRQVISRIEEEAQAGVLVRAVNGLTGVLENTRVAAERVAIAVEAANKERKDAVTTEVKGVRIEIQTLLGKLAQFLEEAEARALTGVAALFALATFVLVAMRVFRKNFQALNDTEALLLFGIFLGLVGARIAIARRAGGWSGEP